MNLERVPLIVTDGFAFYKKAVVRVFGPACLYGQVIKTRRNNRIVKVERKALIGDAVAIGRDAARLQGLVETEHVFRRTAQGLSSVSQSVAEQNSLLYGSEAMGRKFRDSVEQSS